MIARLLAALVALAVIFGAVQVAELRASATVAVEMDGADAPIDMELNVPIEPVITIAPIHQVVAIEMPSIGGPRIAAFSPRTFRPPRS